MFFRDSVGGEEKRNSSRRAVSLFAGRKFAVKSTASAFKSFRTLDSVYLYVAREVIIDRREMNKNKKINKNDVVKTSLCHVRALPSCNIEDINVCTRGHNELERPAAVVFARHRANKDYLIKYGGSFTISGSSVLSAEYFTNSWNFPRSNGT